MTLVVRNEEDILETNLRYHLAQGIDFIYALDHNSTDGTPDILRQFERESVLRFSRERDEIHDQSRRVTTLARMAYSELGADWIINNDADEFWWPIAGNLKDVLGALPSRYGKLIAPRHDFLPRRSDDAPFYESMVWRGSRSLTPTGGILEPKVAHRGARDVVVAPGNHDANGATLRAAPALPLLEVLHFPARTYEQFERKVYTTGRGYELLARRERGVGKDQLKLLELLRAGELERYFKRWARSDEELRRGSEEGHYVRDERLRRFLSNPPCHDPPRSDAQEIRDLIRCALNTAAELEVAHEALTTACNELAEERAAHAQTALAECTHTLEVIRNSKVLRYTRQLRRIYYRLRRIQTF